MSSYDSNIDLNNKNLKCFDADESVIIHKVDILVDLENIIEKLEKIEFIFLKFTESSNLREIGFLFSNIAMSLRKIKNDLKE